MFRGTYHGILLSLATLQAAAALCGCVERGFLYDAPPSAVLVVSRDLLP